MLPLNTIGISRAIGIRKFFTFPSFSRKSYIIERYPREMSLGESKYESN